MHARRDALPGRPALTTDKCSDGDSKAWRSPIGRLRRNILDKTASRLHEWRDIDQIVIRDVMGQ
jgi:hypothetical protein